jgi:catechol 2,3-dioxygenase
LLETGSRVDGASDHLVSEAIYLPDPDGNGIEIYRDRPRSAWEYQNGVLKMDTAPFDYYGVLAELENDPSPWAGLHPDTVLGHMHLHVADLPQAVAFYEKALGFDLVLVFQGAAAFLSAGGYHHHLAVNTWNGVGAPPPPPDAVGLRYFVIQLPSRGEQARLLARLKEAAVPYEERQDDLIVRDPSHNSLVFTVVPNPT